VLVVIGPSGSGKSTFLRCLNGLEEFDSGSVSIDGLQLADPKTDVNAYRREVGMVFQHFNLFPHMTVLENLCLAQKVVRKRGRRSARPRPWRCWKRSALRRRPTSSRRACPAASSSAWRLPGRWRWTRR
jgi:polar amino acid transport system ATP-binding protein